MKVLTTLEMIDDYIKSNHTKKYRELEKGDNDERDIVSNGGGIDGWLCWGGNSKFMFPISRHNLTLKWEEVKQPYTFLEAYEKVKNNKESEFETESGICIGQYRDEILITWFGEVDEINLNEKFYQTGED